MHVSPSQETQGRCHCRSVLETQFLPPCPGDGQQTRRVTCQPGGLRVVGTGTPLTEDAPGLLPEASETPGPAAHQPTSPSGASWVPPAVPEPPRCLRPGLGRQLSPRTGARGEGR